MYAWMKYHFSLVGDEMPNTPGELHLEKQEKKTIHAEYEVFTREQGDEPLSYMAFLQ